MYNKTTKQQKGVATLTVSVSVALLMAVAAVGMMRSSMLEQRIAANDLRAREAQEIAQAGLESIMASNYSPSENCIINNAVPDLSDSKFEFKGMLSVPIRQVDQTSEEDYISSIRWCSSEGYYFARSQVELNSGLSKTKYFAEAWFKRNSLINNDVGMLSPFFINGEFCIKEKCNNSGKVLNSANRPGVIATGDIADGVNSDIFKSEYDAQPAKTNAGVLNGKSSAWDYIFSISLKNAKDSAILNPGKPFYYFNDGRNVSLSDLNSSADAPVVLILDAEDAKICPDVKGGTIFGIVYISGACRANGWGNAEIHGSVVSDGDFFKLTSNSAEYHGFSLNSWNKLKEANSDGVFVIPGTWKDF